MNLSEGAIGVFLLTLPYKTKIKFVLFPFPQYPPACNLALIDQEPREVSEKIQVIFILLRKSRLFSFFAFVIEFLKNLYLFYKGDYSFIIVFYCKDGAVVATVSCVVHHLYKLRPN